MAKDLLRIRDLGHERAHAVLARASQVPGVSLHGKTTALLFEDAELSALFTGAVQAAGGTPLALSAEQADDLLESPRKWKRFAPEALCLIAQGRRSRLRALCALPVPVLNAGDECDAPLAALTGLLAANRLEPDVSRLRVGWLGETAAEANAWVESALYFPFELFMNLSSAVEPDHNRLALALQAGAKIFLTDEPRLALDGCVWANRPSEAGHATPSFTAGEEKRALSAVLASLLSILNPASGYTAPGAPGKPPYAMPGNPESCL